MRPFILLLLLVSPMMAGPIYLGHDGFRVGLRFEDAVLSPDGQTFALVAYPGLFLLDAHSGQVLRHWECDQPIDRITFDAKGCLVVYDRGHRITWLDPKTGRVLRDRVLTEPGLSRPIFHASGQILTVSRAVGVEPPRQTENTRFVDLTSERPLTWPDDLWLDQRWTLAPNGRRLAIARNKPCLTPLLQQIGDAEQIEQMHHLLTVLDTTTGKELYIRHHPNHEVSTQTFSPDGQQLIVAIYPRVHVIDLERQSERELKLEGRPFERGFSEPFHVSPDGKRLACAESECAPAQTMIREWDLDTGKLLAQRTIPGVRPLRIGYTPGNRLWIWNTHGCRLDVIDLHAGAILPGVGPAVPLYHIEFSDDGRFLVTIDEQNQVCRWAVDGGQLCGRVSLPTELTDGEGTTETVEVIVLNKGATGVTLMTRSLTARLDVSTGRLGSITSVPLRTSWCSPDGRWIVGMSSANEKDAPQIVDVRTGRCRTLPVVNDLWPGGSRGTMPVFSPDGRFLAEMLVRPDSTRSSSGMACVIVHKTARGIVSRFKMSLEEISGPMLFTPDGRSLIIAHDGCISRYETASGRRIQTLNPPAEEGLIVPLAVSPDGRYLLVLASESRHAARSELQLVEIVTGTVRRSWSWPQSRSSSTLPQFSPDGSHIALPRDDGTVVLLPTASEAASPDRAEIWRDLAASDAAVAGAAMQALISRPDAARWIRARQIPAGPEIELPALFWLVELEHDEYARREAARRALARQPERIDELEAALTGPPSVDLARTLAALRERPTDPPTAEERRLARLREVLDRLPKPEARPTP